MSSRLVKDHAIYDVIIKLRNTFGDGAFQIVDHWEDLCAIGIARSSEPHRLVYISSCWRPPGYYFVELELPPEPGIDRLYSVAQKYESVDLDQLKTSCPSILALQITQTVEQ